MRKVCSLLMLMVHRIKLEAGSISQHPIRRMKEHNFVCHISLIEMIRCQLLVIKIYGYRFKITCGACRYGQIQSNSHCTRFQRAAHSITCTCTYTIHNTANDIHYLLIDF